MKLGLIADIHESVERLDRALLLLRDAGADQCVMLGDVFETGHRLGETVALLREAEVPGVWGNHDYGLCVDPRDDVKAHYGPEVIDYMTTLRPKIVREEVHIQHTEPRGNPEALMDLWIIDDWPPTPEKLVEDFAGFDQRIAFAGHRHTWRAYTPEGPLPWQGEGPLRLPVGARAVVIVHAVVDGWCAVFDDRENVVIPIRID